MLVGAAVYLVDFTIDGYAMRTLAEQWAAASSADRPDLEFTAVVVLLAVAGPSLASIILLWGVPPCTGWRGKATPAGWVRAGMVVGAAVLVSGIAQFLQPGFGPGLVVYAALPLIVQL